MADFLASYLVNSLQQAIGALSKADARIAELEAELAAPKAKSKPAKKK